jgi:hypothetical protein
MIFGVQAVVVIPFNFSPLLHLPVHLVSSPHLVVWCETREMSEEVEMFSGMRFPHVICLSSS